MIVFFWVQKVIGKEFVKQLVSPSCEDIRGINGRILTKCTKGNTLVKVRSIIQPYKTIKLRHWNILNQKAILYRKNQETREEARKWTQGGGRTRGRGRGRGEHYRCDWKRASNSLGVRRRGGYSCIELLPGVSINKLYL